MPETYTEVRAFCGLVGHYRRFIKGFAHIAHPLYDVLGNEVKMGPVKLPMSVKHAVWELKEKIQSAPVLVFPDFEKPFPLETERTSIPNWTAQLLRMFKFRSCLVHLHFRPHLQMCYRQHNSGNAGQEASFWVSHVNQSLQLARTGQLIQRRLAITARTWVMTLTIVCIYKDGGLFCHIIINQGVS